MKPRSGCPHARIEDCPLYVIGHDMNGLCHLGCVDDLAKPCRVKRGLVTYDGMVVRANREIFKRAREALARREIGRRV